MKISRREWLRGLSFVAVGSFLTRLPLSWASSLPASYIQSGFYTLDRIKKGFYPGELTLVAGRPRKVRAGLAIYIAKHVTVDQNKAVLFVSNELAKEQLMMRMMSMVADVSMEAFRSAKLSESEFERVGDSAVKMSKSNLTICDDVNMSPAVLADKIRNWPAHLTRPDLVIIDRLVMAKDPDNLPRKEEAMARISELKDLAIEFNLPILVTANLSQNRSVKVMLESRADSVIAITKHEEISNVFFEVLKNKFGRVGACFAHWNKKSRADIGV